MDATVDKLLTATLKFGVSKLLGQVPVVGGFLNMIVGVLWPQKAPHVPTPEEVFDSIKGRIEILVDAKITANDVTRLQTAVSGIGDVIKFYQQAADDKEASSRFDAASAVIIDKLDEFTQKGLEVTVLPLYAQSVNAWLAFLRDGVLSGPQWGYTAKDQATAEAMVKDQITTACQYVDTWYQAGLAQRQTEAQKLAGAAKFNHVNDYVREMTLLVMDYRELWPMFDPVAYPKPVQHTYTREIYGPARAQEIVSSTPINQTPVNLPPPPAGPIRQVHAKSWIYGLKQLQVDYDQGQGPGGKDTTGPMGSTNYNGFRETKLDIAGATLTNVITYVGDITDGIAFEGIYQGTAFKTNIFGAAAFNPPTDNTIVGHQVSSIYVDGHHFWNTDYYPDVIVVGFKADPDLPI